MAPEPGTRSDVIDVLRAVEERPYECDFFALLRYLESLYPDKPRFGKAERPSAEPVRLGQEPSLAFAPSTLAYFQAGDSKRPHRLGTYFFGLFGPQGPLPVHLTEYAIERELHEEDATLRHFADLFHHRLAMLFYRAWANANPVTSLDRKDGRRFDDQLGSLCGLGMSALREESALPASAKLYMAGLLSLETRPAKVLLALLTEYMQLEFSLQEFSGEWLRLPRSDRLVFQNHPSQGRLGVDTVLGGSVWSCQHKFRLVCGPLNFDEFRRLLPGRDSLMRLTELVLQYVGFEYEWDLNLVLEAAEVPRFELGQSGELGWTTWLGERPVVTNADEVIIHPLPAATNN